VAKLGMASTAAGESHAATASLEVVGLRLHPAYRVMTEQGFIEPGPRAEFVAQPWTVELESARAIDPAQLTLELPAGAGPARIGRPDPWYELAGAKVTHVTSGRGALRRGPGSTIGSVADRERAYAERLDGTLDAARAISGDVEHTFFLR
jgi:hypothetical protein